MKKVTNYVMAVLCVGSLAFSTGAFMKVNASPAVTAEAPGQPVDLTYAAEKALPAVFTFFTLLKVFDNLEGFVGAPIPEAIMRTSSSNSALFLILFRSITSIK